MFTSVFLSAAWCVRVRFLKAPLTSNGPCCNGACCVRMLPELALKVEASHRVVAQSTCVPCEWSCNGLVLPTQATATKFWLQASREPLATVLESES